MDVRALPPIHECQRTLSTLSMCPERSLNAVDSSAKKFPDIFDWTSQNRLGTSFDNRSLH